MKCTKSDIHWYYSFPIVKKKKECRVLISFFAQTEVKQVTFHDVKDEQAVMRMESCVCIHHIFAQKTLLASYLICRVMVTYSLLINESIH